MFLKIDTEERAGKKYIKMLTWPICEGVSLILVFYFIQYSPITVF